MNEGETEGNPREILGKLPKKDRVAVCLVCTNEWIAHTGNAKKPSKCPVCGSKRCSWQDEITPNAEKSAEATEGKQLFPGENTRETEGETGETGEKTRALSGLDLDPLETVEDLGHDRPGNTPAGKPNTDSEGLPTKGGFPLVLALIVLVLLGTLAGVGWFLGGRRKRGASLGKSSSSKNTVQGPDPSEALKMRLSYGGMF